MKVVVPPKVCLLNGNMLVHEAYEKQHLKPMTTCQWLPDEFAAELFSGNTQQDAWYVSSQQQQAYSSSLAQHHSHPSCTEQGWTVMTLVLCRLLPRASWHLCLCYPHQQLQLLQQLPSTGAAGPAGARHGVFPWPECTTTRVLSNGRSQRQQWVLNSTQQDIACLPADSSSQHANTLH